MADAKFEARSKNKWNLITLMFCTYFKVGWTEVQIICLHYVSQEIETHRIIAKLQQTGTIGQHSLQHLL